MKIGLSTTSIEPSRNGGVVDGIGHYTMHLRDAVRSAGHEVKSYSFPPLRGGGDALREGQPMPAAFALMGTAALLAGPLAPRFAPECDVFHSTDFKVVPMRVPVVATVWDAIPLVHPEWLSARSRRFAPYVLRRLVPHADRFIVASRHAATEIARNFRLDESHISVVPWGIGSDWLAPVPDDERRRALEKFGLAAGFVLNVGTIQPRKNIETLLSAYDALPAALRAQHKLVLVGRWGWGSDALAARLRDAEAAGTVRWLNEKVSDADVRALYACARVFVFPSLYEGFGIPLLESFANGTPVLSSNLTSLPEVSGGAALEIDPRDVGVMTEGLRTLLENERVRQQCRVKGYERARLLTQEKALAATLDVYRDTIAHGMRHASRRSAIS